MKTTPIPFPPRKFLIGNLPQIAGANTIEKMIKLGYEYGPIFEIKVLNLPIIFCTNFELCKELMEEERFPKFIDLPAQHLRKITKDGLFTAWTHEPNWQIAHNVLMPGFAMRSIQGYVPAMHQICRQLMDKWSKVKEDQYINLSDDMTRLTFETIGICGFDYSFGCFENNDTHPFIHAMLFALDEAVQRARVPQFAIPLRFKRNKLFQKHLSYVNELIDSIISKRKETPSEYASKFDLLSLMLNARDKESGMKLSDQNIRYQIITFLVAGHETTSGLLSFAFYYLLTHPEWLQKVYEEVDTVLGADLEQVISAKHISRFKVIRQVLMETLRLQPPVPIINVSPTKDTTIGKKKKYAIKAGTSCLIWPYHLHRDKKIWGEDAEKFNPDNFSGEQIAARDKDAFKAFGNGKRACIGRQFAMTEAILAMAMILQKYKLELHPEYKFGYADTITLRPVDLKVKLKLRTDKERYSLTPLELEEEVSSVKMKLLPHDTPLYVLYGSNMGSSKELAERIAKDARANGFNVFLAPLDCFAEEFPEKGVVQIVTSTYNGIPPDNAKKFYDSLTDYSGDLSELNFAVFGCGNSQWDTYQLFPSFIDRTLSRLGAVRIYPKGAADASGDFDADFEKWYAGYWETVVDQLGLGKADTGHKIQIVSRVADYTPIGEGKYNNHLDLISKVQQLFQLNLSDYIILKDAPPVLIEDLIRLHMNLEGTASLMQVEKIVKTTECTPEKLKLQRYFNHYQTEIKAKGKTVLQLMDEFPSCQIDLALFLDLVID